MNKRLYTKTIISIQNSNEEWYRIKTPNIKTPAVHKLELGAPKGTHVDTINHMAI